MSCVTKSFTQNIRQPIFVMNVRKRKMKFKLKFRRNPKERFWETKILTWYDVSNFLEKIFSQTNEETLEIRVIKCPEFKEKQK